MDDTLSFRRDVERRIAENRDNAPLRSATATWMEEADAAEYEYNFSWLGIPVIQYPQDLVAYQELIWSVRPEWIVETGVARGGSVVFAASMLALLGGAGRVVGVDIDVRPHNRRRIEEHPMAERITLIEGSSTDAAVVRQVAELVSDKRTLVVLDSNHTHEHVLEELRAYAPMVEEGSYLVVCDTSIASLPGNGYPDRPWSAEDNPATAVTAFLAETDRFVVDEERDHQLLITSNPGGFLRCVRNA